MAPRLSERELREIDRDFPHQVELSIRRDGLARADIGWMHRWCTEYCRENYAMPSRLKGDGKHHILRWCFIIREDADAFQRQFGGVRLTAPEV